MANLKEKKLTKKTARKYLRQWIQIAPLGLSIWRSAEAMHFSTIELKKPILDIGCGFGEFADASIDGQIDVGIDIAEKDLAVAKNSDKYKKVQFADARNLPFKDNTFATVMSISTFEHIKRPDKVLKEAYRVLKPGGRLTVTIETDKVDKNSFYRPLLRSVGLGFVSDKLTEKYNKLFSRVVILPKKDWEKKIVKAGFVIEKSQDILSPTIVKLFDFFIITSWPSQIFKPLFGKRLVYRPEFINNWLTDKFVHFVANDKENGTNLMVVARKPRK